MTIDHSHLFQEVRRHAPGLSAYVEWAYGSHPHLFFGDKTLLSETGLQQGDPLGPLLFAVALHPILCRILEEVPGVLLNAWYLDDGTLVGTYPELLKAYFILQEDCPGIGLRISLPKTVLWRHPSCRDLPLPVTESAPERNGFARETVWPVKSKMNESFLNKTLLRLQNNFQCPI